MTSFSSCAGECELIDHKFKDGKVSPFSLPRCRNVYVLPGVPDLLQQKWRTLKVRKNNRICHLCCSRCRAAAAWHVLPGLPNLLQQKWRTLKVCAFIS